jgi:hypothetical protein
MKNVRGLRDYQPLAAMQGAIPLQGAQVGQDMTELVPFNTTTPAIARQCV